MFDFLILSFINGMRAFLEASRGKAIIDGVRVKRESMEQWEKAIYTAERAHIMLRTADQGADDGMAQEGLNLLMEAVVLSPELPYRLKRNSREEFIASYVRKKRIDSQLPVGFLISSEKHAIPIDRQLWSDRYRVQRQGEAHWHHSRLAGRPTELL